MFLKNSTSALVGLVLGIVWLTIGFSYDNSGIMMFGGLMLSFGLFFKLKKNGENRTSENYFMHKKKQKVLR